MKRNAIEDGIQASVVDLLKVAARPGVEWFAVPNGGKRAIRTAVTMKDTGVKRGVPDMVLINEKGIAHFLEVKTVAGRLSKEQVDFRDRCIARKSPWAMVRDRDEAQAILMRWGLLVVGGAA